MKEILTYLYFAVLFLIIHTYLLYPLLIFLFSKFYKKQIYIEKNEGVSVLISVFNEEKVIKGRIENLAGQNYDFNNIEVLVGSDGSNDNTNLILKKMSEKYNWLKIYQFEERRGKVSVLNDLFSRAKNDILVLTDANTEFESNAIKKLISGFTENEIGGVSGRLLLKEPNIAKNKSIEEEKYWRFETFLKKNEGRCGLQIGANGGIFAIRRNLFSPLPTDKAVTDDLYLSLFILKKGFKFIYNNSAVAFEEIGKEVITEFRRKIRFAATNYQTLKYFTSLLFSKRILVSYSFWSHKIIRWLMPVLMILLFALNLYLLGKADYFWWLFLLQSFFYCLAVTGLLLSKINIRILLFSLPYFFLISNFALLIGLIKFVTGKHKAYWQSTPR